MLNENMLMFGILIVGIIIGISLGVNIITRIPDKLMVIIGILCLIAVIIIWLSI